MARQSRQGLAPKYLILAVCTAEVICRNVPRKMRSGACGKARHPSWCTSRVPLNDILFSAKKNALILYFHQLKYKSDLMYGYVFRAVFFPERCRCNCTNHYSVDIRTKAFFVIQFRWQELCFCHFLVSFLWQSNLSLSVHFSRAEQAGNFLRRSGP